MGRDGQLYVLHYIRTSCKSYVTSPFSFQNQIRRAIHCNPIKRIFFPTIPVFYTSYAPFLNKKTFDVNFIQQSLHSSYSNFSGLPLRPYTSSSSAPSEPSTSKNKSPDFSNLPGARKPVSPSDSSPRVTLQISKQQANDAFQHCLQLVRARDVDSYIALLTLPKKIQAEMIAIEALNVELAMMREKIDEGRGKDTTGMYKLQFWKDSLAAIYGKTRSPVPRQPVAVALCSFAPSAQLDLLENLVIARQESIGNKPFKSIAEVSDFGIRINGSMMRLHINALSRYHKIHDGGDAILRIIKQIAASYAIVNLIRSAVPLMSHGVVLLPNDLLSIHGINADKVYRKTHKEETKAVVSDMYKTADSLLRSARSSYQSVPRPLRPALARYSVVVDHILKKTRKVDYDLYSPHLQRRNPLLLWSLLANKLIGTF